MSSKATQVKYQSSYCKYGGHFEWSEIVFGIGYMNIHSVYNRDISVWSIVSIEMNTNKNGLYKQLSLKHHLLDSVKVFKEVST